MFACNAYIDAQAPWALRKSDPERMETVLATLYISIAQLAVAIAPVIPASAAALLDQMGVGVELRSYKDIVSHWYSPLAESDYSLDAPRPRFKTFKALQPVEPDQPAAGLVQPLDRLGQAFNFVGFKAIRAQQGDSRLSKTPQRQI